MDRYAVGVDFGTQSVRALVAQIGSDREIASSVMEYPHGVMDKCLPDGQALPPDWALQHPQDYLDCLREVVPDALKKANVSPEKVIGLGVDFTACTLLPVDERLTPLCLLPQYAHRPHAWVKLWKHHGAQEEARRMTEIAMARGESFLPLYGGKISSEWMLPKIWETLNNDPEIYESAHRFMEAGDWLTALLTGRETTSYGMAGYKAFWNRRSGYPSPDFLAALDRRMEPLAREKLVASVLPAGGRAGRLTPSGAALCGLREGTAVSVSSIDAHVALPAAGIASPGALLMIMGTSTCHITLSDRLAQVPGMCGAVEDGLIPGYICYEAGQSCVGDHFDWFARRCLPADYADEAREKGVTAHQLLTQKASLLRPGESGLLALDWWNGNRSVLVDADLTGLMLGMTLSTRPEEIYRALIEATAYGSRAIIEAFERGGVEISEVRACGGIARKNPLMMQIYADVTGRDIRIVKSDQASALASAIMGAVAAGKEAGGYDDIASAAREMGGVRETAYRPDPRARAVYNALYGEYARLHDHFGRGENDVMKRLKALRLQARQAP